MGNRVVRLGVFAVAAATLVACSDNNESPKGTPSDVTVSVYVNDDGAAGLGAADVPISGADLTLTSDETGEVLTGTTDATGQFTFTDVPAGAYTLTESVTPPAGAILSSDQSIPVIAPFQGGTVSAQFVYAFNPGAIQGTIYRDDNASGTYDAGDTTLAGFQVLLFGGTDTTATPIDTFAVGTDGTYSFDPVPHGDYTLLVRPIEGATLPNGPTYSASVDPGATVTVDVVFEGGQASENIADARNEPAGTAVQVEGVVTAGTGIYNSTSLYLQDATGGILLYTGDADAAISPIQASMGDSVRIAATTGAYNNEVQLTGATAFELLGTTAVPAPRVITTADENAGLYQGELVQLSGVTIDSVFGSFNKTIYVSDASGDAVVYLDGDANVDASALVVGADYNITGIMSVYQSTYELKPRRLDDFTLLTAPVGATTLAVVRALPDSATVTVNVVVTAATGTFSSNVMTVQDSTAGITVYHGSANGPYSVGDSLQIDAMVTTYYGERELTNVTITDLGSGAVPTPASVTAAEINGGQYQAELVTDSVEVVSVQSGADVANNYSVTVSNATGEFTVYMDKDVAVDPSTFTVGNSYQIQGIMGLYVPSSGATTYELKPRGAADITAY